MPDWSVIKAEYVTGKMSYRKLAEHWGVSFRTLSDRGTREQWGEERKKYRENVTNQTVQKITARASTLNTNKLQSLQESADKMSDVLAHVFNDAAQFYRHIVQVRKGENWDSCERIFDKVDTRAIRDLTASMKDLTYVLRNIYDLPTKQEQTAMDMAAERLKMDKAKMEGGPDTSETGVVEIAPVLEDQDV